jgi:hypothetical protein
MPVFIQSIDPQDIIGLCIAAQHDRHVQMYREAKWLADEKKANARRWENVTACFAEMKAESQARKRAMA